MTMAALMIVAAMVAIFVWSLFAATREEETDEHCPDLFNEEDE